jgi:hypothetical protein
MYGYVGEQKLSVPSFGRVLLAIVNSGAEKKLKSCHYCPGPRHKELADSGRKFNDRKHSKLRHPPHIYPQLSLGAD